MGTLDVLGSALLPVAVISAVTKNDVGKKGLQPIIERKTGQGIRKQKLRKRPCGNVVYRLALHGLLCLFLTHPKNTCPWMA